ncbi:hypothetical protein JW979_08665 [bacterium]|nr:hypothetical protein [candidate division CSSED10-310 bacterium]
MPPHIIKESVGAATFYCPEAWVDVKLIGRSHPLLFFIDGRRKSSKAKHQDQQTRGGRVHRTHAL